MLLKFYVVITIEYIFTFATILLHCTLVEYCATLCTVVRYHTTVCTVVHVTAQ